MKQRTDEWFAIRCGKITASKVIDLMRLGKSGKPSATRKNYIAEKVAEVLTGKVAETFTSAAMQWGNDNEEGARRAYEFETGCTVSEVGFVVHPLISQAGASPDGLVNSDGMVEIKCPNTAQHIATVLNGTIDRKYEYQMQMQLACTERIWCDFVSYDPRMPEELQLCIIRRERNSKLIAEIEAATSEAITEIQKTAELLNTIRSGKNVRE